VFAHFGEIVAFGLWMQKQGYRPSTTHYCVQAIKSVARRTNLLDPESAKTYLASARISEARKAKLAEDLGRFYRWKRIPFEKPNYRRVGRLPFIPLEVEVDQLIAGVGKKTATFLQLLKETGMRRGEAWNLRWTDIDAERLTVTVLPEKNSNPRRLKVSSRLVAMMNGLPQRYEYVFRNPKIDPRKAMVVFLKAVSKQRKTVAQKLKNERINAINFRTLRHFKATMEYHRTRDILHVMQLLGHKSIRNTLVYTHLVDFGGDEFVCKVARNVDEAKTLVEDGFDYVTDVDGMKLFRKRK
jgi:integrase